MERIAPRNVSGYTEDGSEAEAEAQSIGPRVYFLLFPCTIVPAHGAASIKSTPQVPFKPVRLAIAPECASFFRLTDLKVGKNSQLINGGDGVRCSLFPALPPTLSKEEREDHEEFLSFAVDTADIGQSVVLNVVNDSDRPREFSAIFWGTAVE